MRPETALVVIKTIHTIAWAFFAGCIVTIPIAAYQREFFVVVLLVVAVMIEIVILMINRGRCPLTAIAARYTSNRKPNFDIYLPLPIAQYNKEIFGTLFIAGSLYAVCLWMS